MVYIEQVGFSSVLSSFLFTALALLQVSKLTQDKSVLLPLFLLLVLGYLPLELFGLGGNPHFGVGTRAPNMHPLAVVCSALEHLGDGTALAHGHEPLESQTDNAQQTVLAHKLLDTTTPVLGALQHNACRSRLLILAVHAASENVRIRHEAAERINLARV